MPTGSNWYAYQTNLNCGLFTDGASEGEWRQSQTLGGGKEASTLGGRGIWKGSRKLPSFKNSCEKGIKTRAIGIKWCDDKEGIFWEYWWWKRISYGENAKGDFFLDTCMSPFWMSFIGKPQNDNIIGLQLIFSFLYITPVLFSAWQVTNIDDVPSN